MSALLTALASAVSILPVAQGEALPEPHCALVTPAGDPITFTPMRGAGGQFMIAPSRGSSWPSENIRLFQVAADFEDPDSYAIGKDDGLVLQIDGPTNGAAPIILFRRKGSHSVFPVAVGFCKLNADPTPDLSKYRDADNSDATTQVFDLARSVRGACPIISEEGVRGTIKVKHVDPTHETLLVRDSGIWKVSEISVETRVASTISKEDSAVITQEFDESGHKTLIAGEYSQFILDVHAHETSGVSLVQFAQTGLESPHRALAICGIPRMGISQVTKGSSQ